MVDRDRLIEAMGSFMYNHARKGYSKAFAIGVAAVAGVWILLPLLVPLCASSPPSTMSTIAAATPLVVEGHVYDSLDHPVGGADVSVTVRHTSGGSMTKYVTTTPEGYYGVTFVKDDWNVNDLIDVVATYDAETASSLDNLAESSGYEMIDVYFSVPIPEFSDIAETTAMVGLCIVVAMVAIRRRV
jgi:hypothetical protein